ncbi:efflux RND transporter periplasmic adaptor subunit [Pseudomonas sp. dw_358]|uniref:efflux RND transporter periplasmic adaptor subunit n=1 Tax=Pseudomonas sp. dw_358 TaxID=2720083 RepID=UPI001BD4DC32|nr:efflux RND transporter periplasmic adaptor subunit [Pseudomonas sp. dw_358]
MSSETLPTGQRTPSRKRLMLLGVSGLTLAAVLVASGLAVRSRQAHAVTHWTESQALPIVSVFKPSTDNKAGVLTLPAHLQAWSQAAINARVSGYLKDWKTDIGTHVVAGQVLAQIDSPDLDQQLAQAHARLVQEQADARLAETSATRWQNLLNGHSVSRQEVDEKSAAAAAARATVEAAQADYARLLDLTNYKTLRAPFDGTVTARNTDVGALIKADSGSATELFTVSDTHQLRLYVPVPQNYAAVIHAGMTVKLTVPEHPGKQYEGQLVGNSTAVDMRSGTLLAQFVVKNPDDTLMPGDYAEATLSIPPGAQGVSIPSSAMIFRAQGTQVAVIDKDNHVHLRDIHISMDLGATLFIDQGLTATDRVIDNPPDALREGDPVKLAEAGGQHAPKA